MPPLTRNAVQPLLRLALREDGTRQDITSRAVIPATRRIRARIVARSPGILAGVSPAAWTFQAFDPTLHCSIKVRDGVPLVRGQTILTIEGHARSVFAAERTALNLLGHLSGIASLTHEFVKRTRGTPARIYDTRKTLPGLRALEKYAVRVGGGCNHRMGLHDAVLIKTNHLITLGQGTARPGHHDRRSGGDRGGVIQQAIARVKKYAPHLWVEVEVATLHEFRVCLRARPDAILLDNMPLQHLRAAVRLARPTSHVPCPMSPVLEVSGGVTLANVRAIAQTGVERISIGRLTHSASSLDLSLNVLT